VLIGKIREIRADPLTYRSQDFTVGGYTSTYEVTKSRKLRVKLEVQLVDRRSGKIIWREAGMEDQASYSVSGDPLKCATPSDRLWRKLPAAWQSESI